MIAVTVPPRKPRDSFVALEHTLIWHPPAGERVSSGDAHQP